jgi:integrase
MANLTKKVCTAAKPHPTRDVTLWDDTLRGFGLRVWPSGRKVFVIQYRNAQGRIRRLTVGDFGRLTMEQARRDARVLLGDVDRGRDPLEERQRDRGGETVAELAARYLAEHAEAKKKPRSVAEDLRLLEKRVLPVLGRRKVADLTRADLAKLHHSLRDTPTEANRTLSLLSKMLSLAERWGLRPDASNPCRHVEKYRERKRERFLSGDELRRLGDVLAQTDHEGAEMSSAVIALRLLLLTGARRSEVLTLRWAEVDLERGCLRLADSKTGAKVIPLAAPALEVLASAPRLDGNPYVCCGLRPGEHLIGLQKIWERVRRRAGLENVRLHDLRHSFASIGVAAGMGLPILGSILGHSSPATTARYAHMSDDPRHAAVEQIAGQIAAALNGRPTAEVIHFKQS